jgi:phosphorylcholine metabolism protein LicD
MLIRNENERIAYQNLCDFTEVALESLITPIILDGGTLLGAYRDGGFCEDDWNDIDLTTYACEFKKADKLIKGMEAKGFTLKKIWQPKKERTAQLVFKKGLCKIDLMFKDVKGANAWWTVYKYKGGEDLGVVYKSVPAQFYVNLEDIKFGELILQAPKKIKTYLRLRYGNWKTKIHRKNYSCYTTDKCIVPNYKSI